MPLSRLTAIDGNGLVSMRASNGALKEGSLPTRLKILEWGDNPSTKGTFKTGRKTLAMLEANQKALGFERVAIDYNHASVPGSPDYVKGQVPPIFGYGTVRVKEGEGIWLENVQWTPLGLSQARNFEDLSPSVHPETPGEEVDFVHSVALTTNGALENVTFFSAGNPNFQRLHGLDLTRASIRKDMERCGYVFNKPIVETLAAAPVRELHGMALARAAILKDLQSQGYCLNEPAVRTLSADPAHGLHGFERARAALKKELASQGY